MPLFSQHPPGVQIKRWLSILTLLVVVIDCIAAASLFVVTRHTNTIVARYEPLAISGDIAASVSRLHTGLYQYLAEYRPDTVELQGEVTKLRGTIEKTVTTRAAADIGADLTQIDQILEKYGKALQMLPKIGTVTNWRELDELKNVAIGLGGQVEDLAAKMKEHSYQQISEQAARSRRIAATALYVFIAFFLISLLIVVLLLIWWRDFQEMILQL